MWLDNKENQNEANGINLIGENSNRKWEGTNWSIDHSYERMNTNLIVIVWCLAFYLNSLIVWNMAEEGDSYDEVKRSIDEN